MPIVHKKHLILQQMMEGGNNNQISLKFRCSREYIGQVRKKFQTQKAKAILTEAQDSLTFFPTQYIEYKWLLDAKLVKITNVDILKNTKVTLTQLGKAWLSYLNNTSLIDSQ